MGRRWKGSAVAVSTLVAGLAVANSVGSGGSLEATEPPVEQDDLQAKYAGQQMPLEAFFEVPRDPMQASDWGHEMVQRGMVECMEARGWEYVAVPAETALSDGPSQTKEEAANDDILNGLSDSERERYLGDLFNFPEQGITSCESIAFDLAHPLNALEGEYDAMIEAVWSDSDVSTAMNMWYSCVGVDRNIDPFELASISQSLRDECNTSTGLDVLLENASFEAQEEFIETYRETLIELKEMRP